MSTPGRPDDIADLLPWYATGRLSADDRARVEAELERDPLLRANLDAALEEMETTQLDNEAAAGPSPLVWDKIAAAVEAEPRSVGAFERLRSLCASLTSWASLSPVAATGFAAAAALVIVVQGGALLYRDGGPTQGVYHSASQQPQAAGGPQVLVAFAPDVTVARMTEILDAHGATLIDGPRNGMFRLSLGGAERAPADIDRAISALRAEPGVRIVVATTSR